MPYKGEDTLANWSSFVTKNKPESLAKEDCFLKEDTRTTVKGVTSEFGTIKKHYADVNNILGEMFLELCECVEGLKAAFKGSYALKEYLPVSRMTQDIDMSIQYEADYEVIKEVLTRYAERLKEYGAISEYSIKQIIEPAKSGGAELYLNGEKIASVDIGLHDLSYGVRQSVLDTKNVNAFSIERMLADKLSVICSRARFRRAKDLYDTWAVISNCDIQYKELHKCLLGRNVKFDMYPTDENVLKQYLQAYTSLKLTDIRTGEPIPVPEFHKVMTKLAFFIEPLIDDAKLSVWGHEIGNWTKATNG